nr:transporter substrate-binding domain-containing protein [Rheinheimera maricola]
MFSAAAVERKPLIWCLDNLPLRHHYEANKAPYGKLVDLMLEVSAQLDFELVYTVPTPVARCLKQLEQGEVDVVTGLLRSTERDQRFIMLPFDIARTESWFINQNNVVTDAALRLTMIEGRIYSESVAVQYQAQGYQMNTAASIDDALAALYFKQTDVVVGPEHTVLRHIATNARYQDVLVLAAKTQQSNMDVHIALAKNGRYAAKYDALKRVLEQLRAEGKYRLY